MSEATSRRFLAALREQGFDFHAGVPCSLLAGVLRLLEADPAARYVSAVREDAAVGLAAGAWLGGARPVVFLQNSGLGTAFNALASLSAMYELPALLVVSWRGFGGDDAPEHVLTGRVTEDLVRLLGLESLVLEPETIEAQVREAALAMERAAKPVALLVRKGILD